MALRHGNKKCDSRSADGDISGRVVCRMNVKKRESGKKLYNRRIECESECEQPEQPQSRRQRTIWGGEAQRKAKRPPSDPNPTPEPKPQEAL